MSRSRRKTPIFSNAATSDKESKRFANRTYRLAVKERIRCIIAEKIDPENDPMVELYEVSDEWDFEKDGKNYLKRPVEEKDMRK